MSETLEPEETEEVVETPEAEETKELTAEQKRIAELEAELHNVTSESVARRHRIKELEKQNLSADEAAKQAAEEEAEAKALAKYKPIIVRSAATSALTEAGATQGLDSLYKLLDQSAIQIEEDGSVKGLDKEVARIKKEFPILFATAEAEKPATPARPRPSVRADGGEKTVSTAQKTAGQIMAERAGLGRR